MKISACKVDSKKLEGGAWVKTIPAFPGMALKVRGLGNTEYRVLRARLIEEVPRAERLAGLTPADDDRILTECLIETVLVDWRGLEDDDGNPLAFDKAVSRRYLTDPDYTSFRGAVLWAAGALDELGTATLETDAGN